ncbi:MAG TPA: sigma-E factor negative regulatory protein [Burkholderiaceae bacterium]|nr:sigma-E factor negative regulatory protein [Burkholderiaceae bacterium]
MPDDPDHLPHEQADETWAALSSMADGEASSDAQERCLALWAQQAAARERWRRYQLIGDVLRSHELAREEAHDAAFLSALRARLAREPVVLRPARRWAMWRLKAWAAPMAAMAGVAAVAGIVVMLRPTPESSPIAESLAARQTEQPAVVPVRAAEQVQQPVNGRLIRDARLDRYFAAHRQSGTGTAVQLPGAAVRSVDTIVLEDR